MDDKVWSCEFHYFALIIEKELNHHMWQWSFERSIYMKTRKTIQGNKTYKTNVEK